VVDDLNALSLVVDAGQTAQVVESQPLVLLTPARRFADVLGRNGAAHFVDGLAKLRIEVAERSFEVLADLGFGAEPAGLS
jgi:hypothetical protein